MERGTGAIAIFVKTPGLSAIKTRLAREIGEAAALDFYRLSVQAVKTVVRRTAASRFAAAYWAVAERDALGDARWRSFPCVWQGDGGLGERLSNVYDVLVERHGFVVFLGADAPQISGGILDCACQALSSGGNRAEFALGRARDGGFYLFGGRGTIPRACWTDVPYSTDNTAAVLADRLERLGPLTELPRLADVDVSADLPRVMEELRDLGPLLPEQNRVLRWIKSRLAAG